MNTEIKILNLDELNTVFYLDGGELYRDGSRKKQAINALQTWYINDLGIKEYVITERVKYAMANNIELFDYLVQDDSGNYRPVPNNLRALLAMVQDDKVYKSCEDNRGYAARLVDQTGQRLSKTFKSYTDALEWQKQQVLDVWGKELIKYNVYNKYFSNEPITREAARTVIAKATGSKGGRAPRWKLAETVLLKRMYNRGDKLKLIASKLSRTHGMVQSKIFKLNKYGLMTA